jgi:twitching motility two-component system response regulator PilG
MIVDDSPTVRKLVEVILSREGYEVVAVPDGREALRYLLASDRPLPDLILLDIQMPCMNGYQLALSIRKRPDLAPIPLVMLSRRAGVIDKLKARLAGMRDWLPKPFTEQDLRAMVVAFVGPAHDESGTSRQSSRISIS